MRKPFSASPAIGTSAIPSIIERLKHAGAAALNPHAIDLRLRGEEVRHDGLRRTAVPLAFEFGDDVDVGIFGEDFFRARVAVSIHAGAGDAVDHDDVAFAAHALDQVFAP